MKALIKRIGRLEVKALVKNCRRQSFFVGGGSKGDDVREFLKSIGYDVQPNDFVIHFIGMPEDDAGPLVDLTGQYGREVPRRRPATTDAFGPTGPNPS
jgi:hypothetical protein